MVLQRMLSYSCVLVKVFLYDKFLEVKLEGQRVRVTFPVIGGKQSKPINSTWAGLLLFKKY